MYFKILLATDLTQKCRKVERKAWELANQFDAKLHVIHVIEPIPASAGLTDLSNPYVEELKKRLHAIGKSFFLPNDRLHLEVGSAKEIILAKAKELHVDLIVLGNIGKSSLMEFFGSTARAILQDARCDVLTVRCEDTSNMEL